MTMGIAIPGISNVIHSNILMLLDHRKVRDPPEIAINIQDPIPGSYVPLSRNEVSK